MQGAHHKAASKAKGGGHNLKMQNEFNDITILNAVTRTSVKLRERIFPYNSFFATNKHSMRGSLCWLRDKHIGKGKGKGHEGSEKWWAGSFGDPIQYIWRHSSMGHQFRGHVEELLIFMLMVGLHTLTKHTHSSWGVFPSCYSTCIGMFSPNELLHWALSALWSVVNCLKMSLKN